MQYPDSRTVPAEETWAGLTFPDPYRWLEDDSAEVLHWQREQSRIASEYLTAWPHLDELRRLVDHHVESGARWGANDLPRQAAGRWFRSELTEGQHGPRVIVADKPFGRGRIVFEPARSVDGPPVFVSWLSPSPDGEMLAVGVCDDGSERNRIVLVDVASAEPIPNPPTEVLPDAAGGAHWLPDSTGFFFSSMEERPDGLSNFHQQVSFHRVGAETTLEPVPWADASGFRVVVLSGDGRYAIAFERQLTPTATAFAPVVPGERLAWRPFITHVDGTVAGHIVGDSYVAVTDIDAPRGRVVAVPLDAPEPSDPRCWTELVAQGPSVIRSIAPVGDKLVITEFLRAYGRARVIDRDGSVVRDVPLPGRGAITDAPSWFTSVTPQDSEQFLLSFSSHTESRGIYRFRLDRDDLETVLEPRFRLQNAEVIDREVASKDGTLIPFRVIQRADSTGSAPRPTLIYAYGGFNLPFVPAYAGELAAFVAAGGVVIHANIRGGGEFGKDWWHDGRLEAKQNGYDDLYAIAESLIDSGMATPELLGVTGASNGGLLAGVAVTQRPDLWSVVVPRVPILDLLGGCRDPYGRAGITLEYGDPDVRQDVRRMATYSPYHNVRPGTRYPAVFFDVGGTDPRCPAWHARKLAASLQAASSGREPVLIRVREGVGHGAADSRETTIDGVTEWLGFVMMQLGMKPPAS